MGVSENSVPLLTQWLVIIIPMKNGYFIGNINPTFSGPNPYIDWKGEGNTIQSWDKADQTKDNGVDVRPGASQFHPPRAALTADPRSWYWLALLKSRW